MCVAACYATRLVVACMNARKRHLLRDLFGYQLLEASWILSAVSMHACICRLNFVACVVLLQRAGR